MFPERVTFDFEIFHDETAMSEKSYRSIYSMAGFLCCADFPESEISDTKSEKFFACRGKLKKVNA